MTEKLIQGIQLLSWETPAPHLPLLSRRKSPREWCSLDTLKRIWTLDLEFWAHCVRQCWNPEPGKDGRIKWRTHHTVKTLRGEYQGHCNKFLCIQMTKGKHTHFSPNGQAILPCFPLMQNAQNRKQNLWKVQPNTWNNDGKILQPTVMQHRKKIVDNVERGIWIGNVGRELEIQKFIHKLKKSQTGGQASSGFESCFYTCRSSRVRSWGLAAQLFSRSNTTCSIGILSW